MKFIEVKNEKHLIKVIYELISNQNKILKVIYETILSSNGSLIHNLYIVYPTSKYSIQMSNDDKLLLEEDVYEYLTDSSSENRLRKLQIKYRGDWYYVDCELSKNKLGLLKMTSSDKSCLITKIDPILNKWIKFGSFKDDQKRNKKLKILIPSIDKEQIIDFSESYNDYSDKNKYNFSNYYDISVSKYYDSFKNPKLEIIKTLQFLEAHFKLDGMTQQNFDNLIQNDKNIAYTIFEKNCSNLDFNPQLVTFIRKNYKNVLYFTRCNDKDGLYYVIIKDESVNRSKLVVTKEIYDYFFNHNLVNQYVYLKVNCDIDWLGDYSYYGLPHETEFNIYGKLDKINKKIKLLNKKSNLYYSTVTPFMNKWLDVKVDSESCDLKIIDHDLLKINNLNNMENRIEKRFKSKSKNTTDLIDY